VVAVAGGCATPRPPPDLAHIIVDRAPSSRVLVEKGWLVREHEQLFLVGEVAKQLGDPETTATHLDVRLLDRAGKVLREETVEFTPRQIPWGRRMHGHSSFRYRLDPLPPETARIEVAAHETVHTEVPTLRNP
jgi:hypothetical protein